MIDIFLDIEQALIVYRQVLQAVSTPCIFAGHFGLCRCSGKILHSRPPCPEGNCGGSKEEKQYSNHREIMVLKYCNNKGMQGIFLDIFLIFSTEFFPDIFLEDSTRPVAVSSCFFLSGQVLRGSRVSSGIPAQPAGISDWWKIATNQRPSGEIMLKLNGLADKTLSKAFWCVRKEYWVIYRISLSSKQHPLPIHESNNFQIRMSLWLSWYLWSAGLRWKRQSS